jgi:uncharacterized protein with beta-barrel porin domain
VLVLGLLFQCSSAVERPAVNRLAVGSSPTTGAKKGKRSCMWGAMWGRAVSAGCVAAFNWGSSFQKASGLVSFGVW